MFGSTSTFKKVEQNPLEKLYYVWLHLSQRWIRHITQPIWLNFEYISSPLPDFLYSYF